MTPRDSIDINRAWLWVFGLVVVIAALTIGILGGILLAIT